MINIYSNQEKDILLCTAGHRFVMHHNNQAMHENISDLLPVDTSEKQVSRAASKQLALRMINQLAMNLNISPVEGKFSVSHANDITSVLASYRKDIVYSGVDIEQIDATRSPRPFMLDYIARSGHEGSINNDKLRLSVILFCCMESIYKSLSLYRPITFCIDDYRLVHIARTYCLFDYIGKNADIYANKIFSHYYQVSNMIIALTFMNQKLHSFYDESTQLKL